MSKTATFTKLLDQAQTPLQTHIVLAQLAMLRKLDRQRNERGQALLGAIFILVAICVWGLMAATAGLLLRQAIFGH